jgi:uncharacterized cofD-like protein
MLRARSDVKKDVSNPKHSRGLNVVALGGGTGLSTLLRGLKDLIVRRRDDVANQIHPIANLTAIVTVTDDGGSSGRLRRENRILPPGDIRNCMVALSQDEALLARLFQYRFHAGRGLVGHNFGNLFLAALTHVTGDFAEAVRVSSKILAIRGQIFPSTVSNVSLIATLEGGRRVHGETRITASRKPIKKLALSPRSARPLPKALEAIQAADLILLGPGSLYTSILPNLLIPEIAQAIAKSKAPRVYVANLMTQPGETSGYALDDHLRAIRQHTPRRVIDWVVANRQPISPEVARRYRAQGAEPVAVNLGKLQKLGYRVILDNLLEEHGVIRHNPARLSQLLFEEFLSPRRSSERSPG